MAAGLPSTVPPPCSIGVDLGGTKTEAIVLDAGGTEVWRQRISTPSAQGYDAILAAIAGLVGQARQAVAAATNAAASPIGFGTPGALTSTGLMKNANTQCLNGRPLRRDLQALLGQTVSIANDANCLALSEATDGAGQGANVVFAAILGTGTGAGIAVHGRVLTGPNSLAGEWGHNPLPWAPADEPRLACYCGQVGCVETLVSGPGIAADHALRHGGALSAADIAAAANAGDAHCAATLERHARRLARALAVVINLLDPEVIVLGGGLSAMPHLYRRVPVLWGRWVFAAGADGPLHTRLLPALHGDSSGVRGAAWLWSEQP